MKCFGRWLVGLLAAFLAGHETPPEPVEEVHGTPSWNKSAAILPESVHLHSELSPDWMIRAELTAPPASASGPTYTLPLGSGTYTLTGNPLPFRAHIAGQDL